MELIERPPTPAEYAAFREAVGWWPVSEEGLEAALGRALYSVVIEDEGAPVAMGRVIGDGGPYLYIQDMIVLPSYQGHGLGARLMGAIMDWIRAEARPGCFIGLMAAQGAVGFYERYGFQRRGSDKPGMFLIID